MGWLNFSGTGSGSAQADDAEICSILETGQSQFTLPYDIQITDIVLAATATNNHEFRIYVNGKAQGAQFFAGQVNPATQGRLNWANQNIRIPKGATIQIKKAQKAGTIEATTLLLQFLP